MKIGDKVYCKKDWIYVGDKIYTKDNAYIITGVFSYVFRTPDPEILHPKKVLNYVEITSNIEDESFSFSFIPTQNSQELIIIFSTPNKVDKFSEYFWTEKQYRKKKLDILKNK